MKKFAAGLFLIIGIAMGSVVYVLKTPILFFQKIEYAGPSVSVDALKQHVSMMVNTPEPRNHKNTHILRSVANNIAGVFSRYCDFIDRQKFTVNDEMYENLICRINGSKKKDDEHSPRFIIGAHYDCFDDLPGADDNASGVAGLLELIRMFRERLPENDLTYEFVAYTLEEPPYFRTPDMGSAIHAKSLAANSTEVEGMLSLEMIGYFTDDSDVQEYPMTPLKWIFPSKGNYIAIVGSIGQRSFLKKFKSLMLEVSKIQVQSLSGPRRIKGVDFSDHLNYWNENYKALMITDTAFYRNKEYHKKGDTMDRLNFEKMGAVVEAVYWALAHWKTSEAQ